MHSDIFTHLGALAERITEDTVIALTPLDKKVYLEHLEYLGHLGVRDTYQIAAYMGLNLKGLLKVLIKIENAIETYRRSTMDLKLKLHQKLIDIALSDDEKNVTNAIKGIQIIMNDFFKDSESRDRLKLSKDESRLRFIMEAKKIAMEKTKMGHAVSKDFAMFIAGKDEETIDRLDKYFSK